MENIINTKEDLISSIERVYKTLPINDFLDSAFHLLDTNAMTEEEFQSILMELAKHNEISFIGA